MKVLIVSGGSGGHIFPAIAVCWELLRHKDVQILFVASRRRLDMELLEKEPFQKRFFSINPLPHKAGFGIFIFLTKLLVDTMRSLWILFKYRPHVVVGFGGYTGAALIATASAMRIPTIIHEQNVMPGRANKALDRFADKVCVSFEGSRRFFKNKNIVYTGNPIRASLLENRDSRLDLDHSRFTILVMGGSQGARSLNRLIVEAIGNLEDGIKRNLQVIHIAGRLDREMVKDAYKRFDVENRTYGFIERIEDAYRACDLAISRAGAAACFEISFFKKPMVLIPFPHSGNNQRFNARFFASQGACIYREEDVLSWPDLKAIIEELIKNPSKREELSLRIGAFSRPDAAQKLADEISRVGLTYEVRPTRSKKQRC